MSDGSEAESSTCEDDVGDVAMTTVGQLLRVGQVAVTPRQIHHEGLRVVEGGGRVVQAVRADRRLHHVELLQLHQEGGEVSRGGGGHGQLSSLRDKGGGKKRKKVTLLSLPDLLGEGAGLGRRKLLVVEVCKHTAQYGVMLEQKKKSQNDICVFNMCHPAGTKTNLGKDVDTVKAATALNNQKNQLQPTVSGTRFRLRLLTWTGSRSAMHWLTLPT